MAELRREYTDLRGRTHAVEHTVNPDKGGRERLLEELADILTRPGDLRRGGEPNGDCPVRQKIRGAGEQHQL